MLLSPLPDAPADAHALDFRWQQDAERLQVSASETFDTLAADVPVRGLDSLTLQGLLPADGRTYFWRVGQDGAWSEASRFRSSSPDAVFEWEKARELAAQETRLEELRSGRMVPVGSGAAAAGLVAETSAREAQMFVLFLIASFSLIALIVFRSVM